MSEEQPREVARFYTRIRKIRTLFGRFPDGTKLWGGPYSGLQVAVAVVALIIALPTRDIWGFGMILLDLPASVAIAWGAAYLAGFIPITRRSPGSVVMGAAHAMSSKSVGRYKGQVVRLRPPHFAGGKAAIDFGFVVAPTPTPASHPETAQPATAAVEQPAAITTPEPARPLVSTGGRTRPVSGVERLLAQSRGNTEE